VTRALCLWLLLCGVPAQAQEQPEEPPYPSEALPAPTKNAAERALAARRAGEAKDSRATLLLLDYLHDEDAEVRRQAALSLGLLGAQAAVRDLAVAAQVDGDPRVRQAAAEAVRLIDQRSFLTMLATSDKAPVEPAPVRPSPVDRPNSRPRVILAAGAVVNALRADESAAAQVGAGLRWPRADLQLSLGFPALSLLGQVRVGLLREGLLVPYLSAGLAVAYNNGSDCEAALSAAIGGGLRLRLVPPLHLYLEALANWVLLQATPAGSLVEVRTLSVPVIAGLGLDL